jgi:hypothetical protein
MTTESAFNPIQANGTNLTHLVKLLTSPLVAGSRKIPQSRFAVRLPIKTRTSD